MTHRDDVYDLIGVGFGPSNLALAVRLAECGGTASLRRAFIERQSGFGWHRGMLLDDSRMQISFLKDLATLRNPTSRFTFVNYLFEHGRLQDFVNLKQGNPSRIEFHDYLCWVASAFERDVGYGEEVTSIEPVFDASDRRVVTHVSVQSRNGEGRVHRRVARALSIGIGGTPCIPAPLSELAPRREVPLIHSSAYLSSTDRIAGEGATRRRVAVIGGGQSAAEVFLDLSRRFAHVDATLVTRAPALRPADDTPFVNEIFNPSFTDVVFERTEPARRATLRTFRDTNYSVVDRPLIEQIYELLYMQRVQQRVRHRLLANVSIESARSVSDTGTAGEIELVLSDAADGSRSIERFDAIVLATGYRRDGHWALLDALADALGEPPAQCAVTRDYRLRTGAHFQPRIYLQGCCEATHGLSDTLLSVLACRADEIAASLARAAATDRIEAPSSIRMAQNAARGREAIVL